MGPGDIMESASAAIPTYLYRGSSSAPNSNPVDRTPNLYNIHSCEEGGKNQNTGGATKSMSMKKCEDKGIRTKQSKLQTHIFFDWVNTLRGIYVQIYLHGYRITYVQN